MRAVLLNCCCFKVRHGLTYWMQIFWLSDATQGSAYYEWKTVCHALTFELTHDIRGY